MTASNYHEPWGDEQASGLSSAAIALRDYMGELSEDIFSAGWSMGLSNSLWWLLKNGPGDWLGDDYSGPAISAEQHTKLKQLQEEAGGWLSWDETMRFVPTEEWVKEFGEYSPYWIEP